MSALSDLVGRRFGRLVVVSLYSRYSKDFSGRARHARWLCKCDCGVETTVVGYSLKNGDSKSCGCLKMTFGLKHGLSGTPIYAAWVAIRDRILNVKHADFSNYGGRGLTMESIWINDVNAFHEYVQSTIGDRPTDDHSIDRRNNEVGYVKGNLRWATRIEQGNNRRTNRVIPFGGFTCSLIEHCRRLSLNYSTVKTRLHKLGWSENKALSTSIRPKTPRV